MGMDQGTRVRSRLVLLLALCLFGWLQKTDAFFGIGWVEETHALLADALLVAILFHVAGAVLASVRHRENLVWAMVTGAKRPLDARHSDGMVDQRNPELAHGKR